MFISAKTDSQNQIVILSPKYFSHQDNPNQNQIVFLSRTRHIPHSHQAQCNCKHLLLSLMLTNTIIPRQSTHQCAIAKAEPSLQTTTNTCSTACSILFIPTKMRDNISPTQIRVIITNILILYSVSAFSHSHVVVVNVNENTQTNVIHQTKLMQSTHQCAIASAIKLTFLNPSPEPSQP